MISIGRIILTLWPKAVSGEDFQVSQTSDGAQKITHWDEATMGVPQPTIAELEGRRAEALQKLNELQIGEDAMEDFTSGAFPPLIPGDDIAQIKEMLLVVCGAIAQLTPDQGATLDPRMRKALEVGAKFSDKQNKNRAVDPKAPDAEDQINAIKYQDVIV